MEFEYSYRFTEKAVRDFDDILHYISLDNTIAAQKLGNKIFEKIDADDSIEQATAEKIIIALMQIISILLIIMHTAPLLKSLFLIRRKPPSS